MLPSANDAVPEDAVGAQLDSEIAALQAQISSLRDRRSLQISAILSSQTSSQILSRLRSAQKQPSSQSDIPSDNTPLLAATAAQLTHNQENLYRSCAGITTFKIHDPDPNAVDGGHVLGLRFDVSSAGKFIHPYYVMLNKPFPNSALLRVHRHTMPPCIALAALAERHLPCGKGAVAMGSKEAGAKKQDLRRFVRALRKEIVAYQNRLSVIKQLRKEFKLDEKPSRKGKNIEKVIADISAADAEAKQMRIEWVDGRIGRTVVGEKGEVRKCVIIGEDGRDWETEMRVMRGDMEGIGERLREGIY